MTTADDKRLNSAQVFALSFASGMLGLFVTSREGITPGFIWTAAVAFAFEALILLLLGSVTDRTGCKGGYELISAAGGKATARTVCLVLGCWFTLRAAFGLFAQGEQIGLYLLEDTPFIAASIALLLTALFALLAGLRRLAGLATLLALVLPPILLIIVVAGLWNGDYGELRVLAQPSGGELAGAAIPAALAASGGECAIFFLGSGRAKKGAYKGAVIAPLVSLAICAAMLCMSVTTIGASGVKTSTFPLVEAARQISIGAVTLTERFDMPLLFCSLLAAIAQLALFGFCASSAFGAAFGGDRRSRPALVLLPVVLSLVWFMQNTEVFRIAECVNAIGFTAIMIVLLPLVSLIALLRKGVKRNASS